MSQSHMNTTLYLNDEDRIYLDAYANDDGQRYALVGIGRGPYKTLQSMTIALGEDDVDRIRELADVLQQAATHLEHTQQKEAAA